MQNRRIVAGKGWFHIPNPNPRARRRLFLFPYAGAGVSSFYQWASPLAQELELVVVHLPGREARIDTPLLTDCHAVCSEIAQQMPSDLPFALFGHSLGALLAYEVCRQLRALDRLLPQVLLLSGRSAAHLPMRTAPYHDLPGDAFFARLGELGGLPEGLLEFPDLVRYVEPIIRADLQINDTYTHHQQAPLDLPIVAFGGENDHSFPLQDVERWQELSARKGALHSFTGGHFFIHEHRQQILDLLLHYAKIPLPDTEEIKVA